MHSGEYFALMSEKRNQHSIINGRVANSSSDQTVLFPCNWIVYLFFSKDDVNILFLCPLTARRIDHIKKTVENKKFWVQNNLSESTTCCRYQYTPILMVFVCQTSVFGHHVPLYIFCRWHEYI